MYQYTTEEGPNGPLFSFKNIHGLTYRITLSLYPNEVPEFRRAYSLSAYCLDDNSPKKKDVEIGKTIHRMLHNFLLHNPDVVLLYVCDLDDNQAEQRQRKFTAWYNLYSDGSHILKKFEFPYPGGLVYYTALIFNPTFYKEEVLISKYEEHIAAMQEYKF